MVKAATYYQDFSKYVINLDDLYNKWIKTVDDLRVNNFINSNQIKESSINSINNGVSTGGNPPPNLSYRNDYTYANSETRCHAYFRMLGLPVTDGEDLFNPGYDYDNSNLKDKIKIANNFLKKPSSLVSKSRYEYLNYILKIFSLKNLNSSVLALSSKNKRVFSACMDKADNDPLNLSILDNAYTVSTLDYNRKDMMQYLDSFDKTPDDLKSFWFSDNGNQRHHFIMPLMVDPRICFAVGHTKNINVPFFLLEGDNADTEEQYPIPGIQQICIDRLSAINQKIQLSDSENQSLNFIKDLPNLKNLSSISKDIKQNISDLNDIYTNTNATGNEVFYYSNFINFSLQLMKELKKHVDIVNNTQQMYHFLPIPANSGPEFGSSIDAINAKDPYNEVNDLNIVLFKSKSAKDKINLLVQKIKDVNEIYNGGQLSKNKSVLGPITDFVNGPSESSHLQNNLNELISTRNQYCNKAINSLKYIEYITGEFSGLGICDVWVILSALYIVDSQVLVSLLDSRAYERMQNKVFNLKTPPEQLPISDALKELASTIKSLYSICDAIYASLSASNS